MIQSKHMPDMVNRTYKLHVRTNFIIERSQLFSFVKCPSFVHHPICMPCTLFNVLCDLISQCDKINILILGNGTERTKKTTQKVKTKICPIRLQLSALHTSQHTILKFSIFSADKQNNNGIFFHIKYYFTSIKTYKNKF